jgi:predicted lipoprotein with Yx(FWY)xxD motif
VRRRASVHAFGVRYGIRAFSASRSRTGDGMRDSLAAMHPPEASMRTLVLFALAVALAGCQRHEPEPAANPAETTPGAQTPPPEATQPSTATPGGATNTSNANTPTPEPAVPTGSDLGVAESADHGKYVVDGTGKTVYMLDKDNATTSTCHDACATEWPPLLAKNGTPKAMDPSLDDGAISVIQRKDGTQQVAYGGHPLYHYAKDTAAGQLNGAGKRDEFGNWSLLGPEGQAAK